MKSIVWCAVLGLLLSACSGEFSSGAGISETDSRALRPADPDLASVYDRSCRSCHTVAATGSPLTGDQKAWEPRTAKGMDVMLESVISGYGGMPPFGLCMDCDVDQFEALITFMSRGE
jgi:cytochrome c5